MKSIFKKTCILGLALATLTGCNSFSRVLNPFYEPPTADALLGEKNDHALRGDTNKEDKAREALQAMASYQRAHAPQPVDPVLNPAVVRMMWIPDHLNHNGDLVPAHYYYLKVLGDRWAVQDAFELQGQLGSNRGGGDIPYVTDAEVKGSGGK